MIYKKSLDFENRKLVIETGFLAPRTNASVTVKYEGTIILVTAVSDLSTSSNHFFPLTVDVLEKFYSSGKIPGGFHKREGRPSTNATLTARLIDRSIRPMFEKGFMSPTHVVVTILSYDGSIDLVPLAIIGASTALLISDIPFHNPIASVSIGYENGKFVVNPTEELNLIVAGNEDTITMVEATSKELSEETIISGIEYSKSYLKDILSLQKSLREEISKEKFTSTIEEDLDLNIFNDIKNKIANTYSIKNKDRMEDIKSIVSIFLEENTADLEEDEKKRFKKACGEIVKECVRDNILKNGKRVDDRNLDEIRDISIAMDYLPMTHGSAVFTRGQTQSLGVTTLGTVDDKQIVDNLDEEYKKRFFLHYNFPPYSVGEASFLRSPGRRELGHGNLAERAIESLLPEEKDFPYTIRIVSDILSSNGSSSMASVCSASLSLMSAGVPIDRHVAGIAMGLIKSEDKYALLTDITGFEDGIGDMDFKVAGSKKGITALQMDIKVDGIDHELLVEALDKAKEARMIILEKMYSAISEAKKEFSANVPRHTNITIKENKISILIGPSGKNIKAIIEATKSKIDIGEQGIVSVFAPDEETLIETLRLIKELTKDIEVGDIIKGKVKKIIKSGLFIELSKGTDGFMHISQVAEKRVENIEEYVKEGELLEVKVKEISEDGKIRVINPNLEKQNK